MLCVCMYTVSQNKTPMQSFCDNFGKYEPILIIISPLHSIINFRRNSYPTPHLKSVAALPCKIGMFNCATLHNSYSTQKRDTPFIYSKYLYRNATFWIT